MKYTSIILLAVLLGTKIQAGTFGAGVSVQEDGGTIYIPINASDKFRIEPTLQFERDEQTIFLNSGTRDLTVTTLEMTVGLFRQSEVYEKISTYYGVRVGYSFSREELSSSSSNTDYENHGYSVAPALGVEYFINEHISLGGEISWIIEYTDERGSDHTTDTKTDSRLIARYYF